MTLFPNQATFWGTGGQKVNVWLLGEDGRDTVQPITKGYSNMSIHLCYASGSYWPLSVCHILFLSCVEVSGAVAALYPRLLQMVILRPDFKSNLPCLWEKEGAPPPWCRRAHHHLGIGGNGFSGWLCHTRTLLAVCLNSAAQCHGG